MKILTKPLALLIVSVCLLAVSIAVCVIWPTKITISSVVTSVIVLSLAIFVFIYDKRLKKRK